MITSDLIEYIKSQLASNISKSSIISDLSQVGWHIEDIEEGFLAIENQNISSDSKIDTNFYSENKAEESEIKIDQYRELPDLIDHSSEKIGIIDHPLKSIVDSSMPAKVWTPIVINPQVEEFIPIKEVEKPVETPVEKEIEFSPLKEVEPAKIWTPIILKPQSEISVPVKELEKVADIAPLKEVEPVKIWTPISIKTKVDEIKEVEKPNDNKIEFSTKTDIEPYNFELSVGTAPTSAKPIVEEKREEFIPTINKNPVTVAFSQPIVSSPRIVPVRTSSSYVPTAPKNNITMSASRSAMIASYSQDILAAESFKDKDKKVSTKKNTFLTWGIALLIISIIGILAFTFVEGYFKIPGSDLSFSFVKKDPKTILLNAPLSISNLESYKVETNISISSPSLSSITTGLSSGEAVKSRDKDFISINTKGVANHEKGKLIFDYLVSLKSSLLDKDLVSDWKYNGDDLYISVPDLSQIFGKDAPLPTTFSTKPKQLGLIVGEFSPLVQDTIKKIDINNIASGEISLSVKNQTAGIFKEFINGLDYTEKGTDQIHGVDTYHYELTASRSSTKKLLISFLDLFVTNLDDTQKKDLDEVLGSSSISSFEVWVGQNDDNLYQIKFVINAPLSKVLRLNDSGIAGNEVSLEWVTTYYDLGISNEIVIPEAQFDMDSFIKNIRDIKIKNIVSSFSPQAKTFLNATGSFGKRLNPTGSCTNPNPGSIFSPLGHTKGADASIGAISNTMNSLLSVTNGAGSCYSTSKEWALGVPMFTQTSDSSLSFYCMDSTGNKITTATPLSGTSCE